MRSLKIPIGFIVVILSLFPMNALCLEHIHPGIEVGINYLSSIYDNPLESWETKWRLGYALGGVIEISISTNISLKTGLRYVQLGNRVEFELTDNEVEAQYSGNFKIYQNYVFLPLLCKINTVSEPQFFFQLGPEFGSLISAKTKCSEKMLIQSLGHNTQSDREEDITNSMKPYNICLSAGFGITLKVLSQLMNMQIEYSHGIVGTAKKDHWISDWKTREMKTTLGFIF
jgi:hypothetical protein